MRFMCWIGGLHRTGRTTPGDRALPEVAVRGAGVSIEPDELHDRVARPGPTTLLADDCTPVRAGGEGWEICTLAIAPRAQGGLSPVVERTDSGAAPVSCPSATQRLVDSGSMRLRSLSTHSPSRAEVSGSWCPTGLGRWQRWRRPGSPALERSRGARPTGWLGASSG